MADKHLSIPMMVVVTGAWLDAGPGSRLIRSLPHAGALVPALERAHQGVLQALNGRVERSPELSANQAREIELDQLDDRKARGLHGALTAFAELADEPADAAAYLDLRDRMFPQGLDVMQLSYVDATREAELLERLLDDDDRALLERVRLPGGSLLDQHHARVTAARQLGELQRISASCATTPTGMPVVTPGSVVRARNTWLRTVRAFAAAVDLDELLDADREAILGPLLEAERSAARRGTAARLEPVSTDGRGRGAVRIG